MPRIEPATAKYIHKFHAICAPGLEAMLEQELAQIGAENPQVFRGGVSFQGGWGTLVRVSLESGLSIRVLLELQSFPARHFDQLVRGCEQIDWARWLNGPPEIRVNSSRSRLFHTKAIAERVRGGVESKLSDTGSGDLPNQPATLWVRIFRDRCTVSLDCSGEALHKRGWKKEVTKAPLREDLAYALLLVAGWKKRRKDQSLVDPMCGSGTLVIEAARMRRKIPPGLGRSFSFLAIPGFQSTIYEAELERIQSGQIRGEFSPLFARDRDAGAIRISEANAKRAEVLNDIDFSCAPLESLSHDEKIASSHDMTLVCNPPYGHRIGDARKLKSLYAALGRQIRNNSAIKKFAYYTSDSTLAHTTGLAQTSQFLCDLGGIKIKAYTDETSE